MSHDNLRLRWRRGRAVGTGMERLSPTFRYVAYSTEALCWPHLETAERGDRESDADLNWRPSRGLYIAMDEVRQTGVPAVPR